MKLDYSLTTMEERTAYVNELVAQTPQNQLTPKYLEILADYIIEAATKEERREHRYLTANRQVTINKRETSYENLVSKFENGEDGLYNLMIEDKNVLLSPKIEITEQDIEEVPGLKELRATIDEVEARYQKATGKDKYILKKQLIDLRRDQYSLKMAYKQPMAIFTNARGFNKISLDERRWIDENGEPQSDGLITFFNPLHNSALLCNYSLINFSFQDKINNDFYYLLQDFNKLIDRTFTTEPLYYDLIKAKINGKSNAQIQQMIEERYHIKYSLEYISSLWRNKIPRMMAEQAKEDYLIWYHMEHGTGTWKKCSKCGQIKLATNRFFSKNNTSKDGWYSMCKRCRNSKNKKEMN